jgi:hypothetical protein
MLGGTPPAAVCRSYCLSQLRCQRLVTDAGELQMHMLAWLSALGHGISVCCMLPANFDNGLLSMLLPCVLEHWMGVDMAGTICESDVWCFCAAAAAAARSRLSPRSCPA